MLNPQVVSVPLSTQPVCTLKYHFYLDLDWNRTLDRSWTLTQHCLNIYPSCQVIPDKYITTWCYMLSEQLRVHPPVWWLRLRRKPSHDETSINEVFESEQEVNHNYPHPSTPQSVYTNMYMPYIKGPKLAWMVNNALYHRFLKWKLKCKNILECELASLPECQKCKKVITWSGNFGMDQYVSWGLSKDEMNFDTIWERCEDFCKL